jgi:hypothetical protein
LVTILVRHLRESFEILFEADSRPLVVYSDQQYSSPRIQQPCHSLYDDSLQGFVGRICTEIPACRRLEFNCFALTLSNQRAEIWLNFVSLLLSASLWLAAVE